MRTDSLICFRGSLSKLGVSCKKTYTDKGNLADECLVLLISPNLFLRMDPRGDRFFIFIIFSNLPKIFLITQVQQWHEFFAACRNLKISQRVFLFFDVSLFLCVKFVGFLSLLCLWKESNVICELSPVWYIVPIYMAVGTLEGGLKGLGCEHPQDLKELRIRRKHVFASILSWCSDSISVVRCQIDGTRATW